jgi:hypothetical protein
MDVTVGSIILLIGGIGLALEGILKLIKPDIKIRGMSLPCGVSLLLTGLGLVLYLLGV